MRAVEKNHLKVVELLATKGADVDEKSKGGEGDAPPKVAADPLSLLGRVDLYATGVTWYGEECPPVRIRVMPEKPGEAPAPTDDGERDVKEEGEKPASTSKPDSGEASKEAAPKAGPAPAGGGVPAPPPPPPP